MIDTNRTSQAQQAILVIVIVLMAAAGILVLGGESTGIDVPGTSAAIIPGDQGEPKEPSVAEAPPTDTPTEAPPTEAPPTEAPPTDAPTEAPATGTSTTEAPGTEAPTTDAPTTDAPATETPVTETPSTEAPSEPAPETTLHLAAKSGRTKPGGTTTYDIVVGSADNGVGAAELAVVVGDPEVATITEVTVLGSGEQEIDITGDGSRADVAYSSRDTHDSGSFAILEVTVEGQSNGETSLSVEAADNNSDVRLFNERGTRYDVTGTPTSALAVRSGGGSATEPSEDEPDAFQFDLVEGEVLLRFDPDEGDTYHGQDRFIKALHITEDEQRQGGPGSAMDRTYQSNGCEVAHGRLSFQPDTGVSQVAVSVSDVGGCEGITLTYAGYELPDGTTGWDRDRAEEQELKDSTTVTLHPGEERVLTVDVIVEDEEQRAG